MKIRFALIGVGGHGSRWAGIIPDLNVVVDPAWSNIALQDILDDPNIEAVVVCVPHNYLAEITSKCLSAGKHVLCEKPGGMDSEQVKNNIELAKKKGLVYKIGYNYRFHDAFRRARKLFNMGVIGDLLFIRARHGFGGREGYGKEWRISKDLGGGGHLHDQGTHLIDMAKSFMGKIDRVEGLRADTYWGSGTEDNAFVLLKSGNVIASIHSSLTQWKRMHTFELYGTKGYLIIEGLGMRYGDGEKLIVGKRTKDPDVVKEKIIVCNSNADNSLKYELEEFISAIRKGTPLDPTPQDAYETLKIVEEVYRKDKI